ncbi:hypothetical protein JTE90_008776 [Oedothorax gibbosus]|uniref:Ig-like domain-containing protein n=1 Tax=Oedothorax gibbosus TaxID=931172 RepID=A0AAV6V7T0_9ARAC|nr:hypothetical protein JTE90_008776 [Oedothorax gibbosus]
MLRWISVTLTITGACFFIVCDLRESVGGKIHKKKESVKWLSNYGKMVSPKFRHYHPQLSPNEDESDTPYTKTEKQSRRSLDGSKHVNLRRLNDTVGEEARPEFAKNIQNITIAVGRDVKMECVVNNLGRFRVAWLRVETKTVLTMHRHVISRNYRIELSNSEHRVYVLHIKSVQEEDRGSYMCQVNTVPMLFQIGHLDVVVPPDIVEEGTSSDLFAREGTDVSLKCAARGRPEPWYTWRREDNKPVVAGNWQNSNIAHIIRLTDDRPPFKNVTVHEGAELIISRVSRLHMGVYLCIASNGVPPAVSRRIQLQVNFPPMIWIPNQLVGAPIGGNVTVECNTEAHPESINYWSRHDGDMVSHGDKFDVVLRITTYKVNMGLTVRGVTQEDFGTYKCFARNSLGSTEGTIRLYEIHVPHSVKEPSSAKIHSLGGSSDKKGSLSDEDSGDSSEEKYPNTSVDIYKASNSAFQSCYLKITHVTISISVIVANSHWLLYPRT